jgi:hypothetical protein
MLFWHSRSRCAACGSSKLLRSRVRTPLGPPLPPLNQYEPGYKPDADEITYFDLGQNQAIAIVRAHIPISNTDVFRARCTGQLQMLAKITQIARKPYLQRVTMQDIRRFIDEFHIDVQIVQENGQEAPARGESHETLAQSEALDDDYRGSTMTHEQYEGKCPWIIGSRNDITLLVYKTEGGSRAEDRIGLEDGFSAKGLVQAKRRDVVRATLRVSH